MVGRRFNVVDVVAEAANVALWNGRVLFEFLPFGSRTIRGYAPPLVYAEKVVVMGLCLASYLECLEECDEECREAGLDAECRQAYTDCINNPDAFAEHARLVYLRFMDRAKRHDESRKPARHQARPLTDYIGEKR